MILQGVTSRHVVVMMLELFALLVAVIVVVE